MELGLQLYQVGFKSILNKVLSKSLLYIKVISGFEIEIATVVECLFPVIYTLCHHSSCLFKSLIDIMCCDIIDNKLRFTIFYTLISVQYGIRITVKTWSSEIIHVMSLKSIFFSAGWLEREVYDFYGLLFLGNYDLRRILTDYGFSGHALRKDFPLTGYVEIVYDDTVKKISYRQISLDQEFRKTILVARF